jgi:hypothetical protein
LSTPDDVLLDFRYHGRSIQEKPEPACSNQDRTSVREQGEDLAPRTGEGWRLKWGRWVAIIPVQTIRVVSINDKYHRRAFVSLWSSESSGGRDQAGFGHLEPTSTCAFPFFFFKFPFHRESFTS